MDLPIFQDNLRSSGGWAADLEKAAKNWHSASPESRTRVKQLQVDQAILRLSSTDMSDAGNHYRMLRSSFPIGRVRWERRSIWND
jgi:hypothetical protein